MALCDIHNDIHLSCHTCIMNHHDGLGLVGDSAFDLLLVYIHGIRPNIDKYQFSSGQHQGCCGRRKRIAWEYDLIARLQATQNSSHLKRRCATRSQKSLLRTGVFLDPCITLLRERTISADLLILYSLHHIISGSRNIWWHVEIYHESPNLLDDSILYPLFKAKPLYV